MGIALVLAGLLASPALAQFGALQVTRREVTWATEGIEEASVWMDCGGGAELFASGPQGIRETPAAGGCAFSLRAGLAPDSILLSQARLSEGGAGPSSRPIVTPTCSGAVPQALVAWSQAGDGGSGYVIDIDDDARWENGHWTSPAPPEARLVSAPAGFRRTGRSRRPLSFLPGASYRVRVVSVATGEESGETVFDAARCRTVPGGRGAPAAAMALPKIFLRKARALDLPVGAGVGVDSNSPAHWSGDTLILFTSSQHPYRSAGPSLEELSRPAEPVRFDDTPNGGRWFEATHKAQDGTLYGWYHHEPAGVCGRDGITAPKIGAAKSYDDGETWEDLGVILEAPADSLNCETGNHYFAGGNGDFSVLPDSDGAFLYFYFSSFPRDRLEQGVATARISASDLDQPVGAVWKWHEDGWSEPGLGGRVTPILNSERDWHEPGAAAYWGPSIHWNTALGQYVMLLNNARGGEFRPEGSYAIFNRDLSDPRGWYGLQRLSNGGNWYPQIIGEESEGGTDKLAGGVARFFMSGHSEWEAVFVPGSGAGRLASLD